MIPMVGLNQQYKKIESKIKQKVLEALDSGQYILGENVTLLEERLAEYAGVKHCVTCSSGTDALVMALLAKGVEPGDVIITTPFTFIATAEAISLVGALPIFVDVDKETFNICPKNLELIIRAFEEKNSSIYPLPALDLIKGLTLKGVIAVDLFGLPANYEKINDIAEKSGLFVIADAAQSFGSSFRGNRAGSLSEITCTSFFPSKPLGCYGDGGAIFCDDDELAEILKSIRVHGQGKNKYENVRIGITGRLDEIQAAILNVKLDLFEGEVESRNEVASWYAEEMADANIDIPSVNLNYTSAWAQYTVTFNSEDERSKCHQKLSEKNVGNAIYYPIPLNEQKVFAFLGYHFDDFPVSFYLSRRVLSLPMHPYLTREEVVEVSNILVGELS